METTQAIITVATSPGCQPRLLGEQPLQAREDLTAYRAFGGYQPLAGTDELLSEVDASGLVGRGGAAFPLAVKLRAVRENGRIAGGTTVIANGEEGEPASIKDRWLLRNRPHLVLDGLRLAATIVEAKRAYVYVSDADSARSIEAALSELDADMFGGVTVEVRMVEPGYVAGEETAAVRALNGGPGQADRQAATPVRRGRRRAAHPGEQCRNPGQSALPAAPRLRDVPLAGHIAVAGYVPCDHHRIRSTARALRASARLTFHRTACPAWCFAVDVRGALMGGYFAGLLNKRVLETTLDHETFRGLGSGLGCGADLGDHRRLPVAVAASVLAYFDRENAGSAARVSTGRRRWPPSPERYATVWQRPRTSTGCAAGQ